MWKITINDSRERKPLVSFYTKHYQIIHNSLYVTDIKALAGDTEMCRTIRTNFDGAYDIQRKRGREYACLECVDQWTLYNVFAYLKIEREKNKLIKELL
jgi:hypothetical protein